MCGGSGEEYKCTKRMTIYFYGEGGKKKNRNENHGLIFPEQISRAEKIHLYVLYYMLIKRQDRVAYEKNPDTKHVFLRPPPPPHKIQMVGTEGKYF